MTATAATTESGCTRPELVNPGAFDAAGNDVDDDCDGNIDNTVSVCDMGLPSNSLDAVDYARAIDLCTSATEASRRWGVISATLSLANGAGTPNAVGHSIRPNFGPGTLPQGGGLGMALLSSGAAAAVGQSSPAHVDFELSSNHLTSAPFPADWLAANGGMLPNAPGCPAVNALSMAEDSVMLTLRIRVPSNAKSFSFASNFFSAEFPEYVCSPYNDFFVALLDSTWAGVPANPTDKNLAFYRQPSTMQIYPVGVNLGYGDTGLFTQCVNGSTGCAFASTPGTINTCAGTGQLAGTGLDSASPGDCDGNSLQGGATGWLQTSGNVVGGEIITLRLAIWDTSDHVLDSLVALDNFQWSVDVTDPGTIPD
ncbi:MAG: choice-of-anchor L domain-containing protein [Myxococcales bacterium]|nr:choice-of-anchor L domain-containing protein [Myxococcales bacterium]